MTKAPYIHDQNIVYPKIESEHMIKSEKVHDYVYDENFDYRLQKGFKNKFIKFWVKFVILFLAKPICMIRYALIIKGRKNIKEYYKLTNSKAMISVSNHTTEWDVLFAFCTRMFKLPEFPAWYEGIESKSGMFYRYAGAFPVPRNSREGLLHSYQCFKDIVNEGKWIHIYPEAACWAFYPAVRNFQLGAFKLAYESNLPVLPFAVTYRAPKGIYKLFKKHPNAKIEIGEPLLTDFSLEKNDAIKDLCYRTRSSIMKMMGIESENENDEIKAMLQHA